MGLPAIQLLAIAARQVSKPIAEAVIAYGKNHPLFRNRILIPVGRSLVHLSTRLRMKRLGLGSPTSVATVSEATALEQASDFIQQVVLFTYSVGVFAGAYYYTEYTKSETVKSDDFKKFKEEAEKEKEELLARITRLEDTLIAAKYKLPPLPVKNEEPSNSPSEPSKDSPPPPSSSSSPPPSSSTNTSSSSSSSSILSRFPLISSLSLDSVTRIVHEGETFIICKRDSSLSIERGDIDLRRLRFRPKYSYEYSSGFVALSEQALRYIIG